MMASPLVRDSDNSCLMFASVSQTPRNPKFLTRLFSFPFYSSDVTPASVLVKKLVAVLESTEKLPLLTYECPGSGLQVRYFKQLVL